MEKKLLQLADRFVGRFALANSLVNSLVERLIPQTHAQAVSCPSGTVMCWDECIDVRCGHYDSALLYDCGPSYSECLMGNFRQHSACGAC